MSSDKAVQAGGVECWRVDDDKTVVKYCDDNIVHIFVPGDDTLGDDGGDVTSFAIVAQNTLRLRIVPDTESDDYQEISENSDEHYDYCTEDINPPPLPPRKYNCQTFPRRRKNLFQHLGLDTTLPSSEKKTINQNIIPDIPGFQVYKKDLEKYLGINYQTLGMDHQALDTNHKLLCEDPLKWTQTEISNVYSNNSQKDLPSFLGIDNKTLERMKKIAKIQSVETQFRSKENLSNSEGYSSIDSSSSLSSCASYF